MGCNYKAAVDPVQKKAVPESRYNVAQIDSMIAKIGYEKDTALLHQLFIERTHQPIPVTDKVNWNMLLADTLLKLGNANLALEMYDSAYALGIRSGDTALAELARKCCYKKGLFWQKKTNYNLALTELEKYFMVAPERLVFTSQPDMWAAIYLADNYLRFGDDKKSLSYRHKAYVYNESLPPEKRQYAPYFSLANALNQNGQFDTALIAARKGLSLLNLSPFQRVYLKAVIAETLYNDKQYREAEASSYEALQMLQGIEEKDLELSYEITRVYADVLQAASKFDSSLQQYRLAIAEGIAANNGSDDSREFSKLYKSLGDCYSKIGKQDSAIKYYHKALCSLVKMEKDNPYALPGEDVLYAENSIAEALDAIAAWWMMSSRTDKLPHALKAFELAMKVDDLLQQQFSFDASKLDYQRLKKKRSGQAIGICYELYNKVKKQEWIYKAWAFSEASKAAVLRDQIKQQIAYDQSADTLVQQIKLLQMNQSDIKIEQFEASNSAEVQRLQKAHDSTVDRYISLITRLKLTNPTLSQLPDTIAGKNFLQAPLFSNTPVVEFFAADSGQYYIFSKNHNGTLALNSCILPDSVFDKWRPFFTNPDSCNNFPIPFQQLSFFIYRQLLLPVLQAQTAATLIIVPDGQLSYLPWDALVTDTTFSSNWQRVPFLVKKTSVTLGFSLDNLLQQNERKQAATANCMAAFAPVFAHHERGQEPLAASLTELQEIKTLKTCGQYFTHENATIRAFRNMTNDADILHISSHAVSGQSEDSCQVQFYDSTLYLHELYQEAVNAKLVVLSACETGLGKFENGEGVYSMSRGFYMAGAKNVITSLWQVNDESTAALFKNFYTQKGASYNMLHHAKLQYIEEYQGVKASPYYWAAFVNTGYTPAGTTSNNWWIAAAAIALLLVGLAIALRKRKTKPVV
ncbi:MAG: CHAT domain-containing tetratricopeptide repeat protein [Bacteroidota bacterium]